MPAAQFVQAVQLAAFEVVLNVPAAHVVQTRSAVAVPAVLAKVPAAQFVHALHDGALIVLLNVPAAHAAHTVSVVAVPGETT